MKKQFLHLTLFVLMAGPVLSAYAQPLYNKTPEFLKGNSIWVFPKNAGLDFNSGTAVPIANANMVDPNIGEGMASVCDRNTGDLLFYTNGETIWNANDQPMANGTGLFGNGGNVTGADLTTRQGALIVPFIEDTNKYYVFSLGNSSSLSLDGTSSISQIYVNNSGDSITGSLFYSVVDMSLNNSLGGVVAGEKNILLDSTDLSEAMIAIPGECGSIWLVVHTRGPRPPAYVTNTPPQYKAYEITAAGINTSPVISPGNVHASIAWLAVSPDRSTIALTGGGQTSLPFGFPPFTETGLELGKFNPGTGEINEILTLEHFDSSVVPIAAGLYSLSCVISPDGSKLYVSLMSFFDSALIRQYDISTYDSSTILASVTNIAEMSVLTGSITNENRNVPYAGFRLYNDTIYVYGSANGSPPYYISRINTPNAAGASCDFEGDAIMMFPVSSPGPGSTLGSETVFMSDSDDTITSSMDTLICRGWQEGVQLVPTQTSGTYFTWNDSSTNSVLTINRGGTYWVNYYTGDCNLFYSDTFHITEGTMQQPIITVDVHVLSTTLSYSTYQWLLNDVAINGATQQDYTVQENGFYRVVVTNEQGCIDTSDVYEVNNVGVEDVQQLAQQIRVWPNPVQEEVFVQAPVPVKLSLSSISGKIIQQSSSTSNALSMRELAAGMYLLRITDKNGNLIKVEKLIKAKE